MISAAILAAVLAAAEPQKCDDLMKRFMPPDLGGESTTDESADVTCAAMPVDLDGTGRKDYLAIVYTSYQGQVLRLVKRGDPPKLVGEAEGLFGCMAGEHVSARDLDSDRRPELLVDCDAKHGGEMVAVFRWNGTALTSMNPRSAGADDDDQWDQLDDPVFFDLDHSGKLVAFTLLTGFGGEDRDPLRTYEFLRQSHGRFEVVEGSTPVYGERIYQSGPELGLESFDVERPGRYVLVVSNGLEGQRLSRNATIKLNGVVVLGPAAFANAPSVLTKTVTVRRHNTIKVSMPGKDGDMMYVAVLPKL